MNSIALLLLRIVFCGSMIFGHGLGKLNKVLDGNFNFSDPIGIGESSYFYFDWIYIMFSFMFSFFKDGKIIIVFSSIFSFMLYFLF